MVKLQLGLVVYGITTYSELVHGQVVGLRWDKHTQTTTAAVQDTCNYYNMDAGMYCFERSELPN